MRIKSNFGIFLKSESLNLPEFKISWIWQLIVDLYKFFNKTNLEWAV